MSPWEYLLQPAILFFLLGVVAALVKSDLEIPGSVLKILSLYLLFALGLKGGWELQKVTDPMGADYRKLSDLATVKYAKQSWHDGRCAREQTNYNY